MSTNLTALPELDAAWQGVERDAAAEGIRIGVADEGGFRTAADTAQILRWKQDDYNAYAAAARKAGRTPLPITGNWDTDSAGRANPRPVAAYGSSFHDFGAARDFKIILKPVAMTVAAAMRRVQDIAQERWGMRSGRTWGDNPHLELAIPLSQARQWWSDFQNHAGHYAPDTSSSSDDTSGDSSADGGGDGSGDGSDSTDDNGDAGTSTPAGSGTIVGILVALAIGVGVVFFARHAGGLKTWQ